MAENKEISTAQSAERVEESEFAARPVKYHNVRNQDAPIFYSDGVIIRRAEAKALVLHFYTGDFSIENEIGYFEEDGSFAPAEILEGELNYYREIHASVAVTLDTAKSLRDKLDDAIKNFDSPPMAKKKLEE